MAFSLTACGVSQDNLDSAVTPLSEQITTINTTLTEMQTLDTTLDGYIDTLESKVTTLETDLKWLQKCLSDVKKGRKGITIIVDSPFEKGKFYLTKERFINKIYECCIYKGYVSYDDIMNEDIG